MKANRKTSALKFKSKLIMVFAFICLIPTVSLVLVSQLMIYQSVNHWKVVSRSLRELLVVPMSEDAMQLASDPGLIDALIKNEDITENDVVLGGNYIIVVYNEQGERVFINRDDEALKEQLASLEKSRLPPIEEFRPGEIIITGAIKIHKEELALNAVLCEIPETGEAVGVAAVGRFIPSSPTDIGTTTLVIILILVAVLVFIISIWISSLVAKEITNPIQKLVDGTQELAKGNLNYHVKVDARDEMGILADSFNYMTGKLKTNAEELKRAEKAAAWQEVAQKLAHEIKNPLTPIQLCTERLKRRYQSRREGYEEVLEECSSTILREVDRLRKLLDEFSRLARMPQIDPVTGDVNSVVQDALNLYGNFPENIEIITDYGREIPLTSIDQEQMERAFFNIIKNAVEAMEKTGGKLKIKTGIHEDSGNIMVTVSDTGSGMSADAMEKLFTPHFSTKKGGTGLGLAIVKKIIDDHNGDITVESEKGKCTVFTVIIPVLEGA
ncbi:HAMP domain-containing protein [Candidatus Poribacteria bacterium]|nr:HAMP domain-containing protein [Candidatus Poribacteria bacterium]